MPLAWKDRARRASVVLAGGLALASCVTPDLAPGESVAHSAALFGMRPPPVTQVDLLFVVDNSNSMGQEQEVLVAQLGNMVEGLVSPPERGGHGQAGNLDLHVAVVSTDLGAQGREVDTCTSNEGRGDQGQLHHRGRLPNCDLAYSAADCPEGQTCPWLTHSRRHRDDNAEDVPIWEDFRCVASLGTGGCGYEQPLEASRRALDPAGLAGPDGPHAGFLRPDSLLAIVYVSDEDDCSGQDPKLYDPDALGRPRDRCIEAARRGQLTPVDEYYDFFVNTLRGGDANRVFVAAIVGLPDDGGDWNPGDSVDALAALQVRESDSELAWRPTCSSSLAVAYPPVRFVDFVYRFGNNGVLHSICEGNWTSVVDGIARKLQGGFFSHCLHRPLPSTSPDACRVIETLGNDRPCGLATGPDHGRRPPGQWHRDLGVVEKVNWEGRRVRRRQCEILPADHDVDGCPDGAADCGGGDFAGALDGWFYNFQDPECPMGSVGLTDWDLVARDSDVIFECLAPLCPSHRQLDQAGPVPCHHSTASCAHGQVRVVQFRQADRDFLDWLDRPSPCSQCVLTVGALCPYLRDTQPAQISGRPLIEAGRCCALGFHAEGGHCRPDRATRCDW